MKKFWWIPILAIFIILVAAMPVLAAPLADNPGKGPIDKIVFIHYPKHETGKPSQGPNGGGVLSPSYKYTGIHWANPTVTFYVNPTDSGVPVPADAVAAIQASFAIWDNASGPLQFVFPKKDGLTNRIADIKDGFNVISWEDISTQYPNAIAVTSIWYYRNSKEITEVDTQMNNGTGFLWSYTEPTIGAGVYADPSNSGIPATSYDIRNIMTHEAGHWIMLGDLYNNKDSFLTMYGYGAVAELKKDTLGYGDVLGVQKAYP